MVTLYVGEDRTRYHAHEDTLCQLPFFRAALQGQFKEALEKSISMPEDDPEAVSALIEWLYTGKSTYDEKRLHETTLRIRSAPDLPSQGLLKGLFYLEVYVVASKYNCPTLQQKSREMFYAIARYALSDIDRLRLLKAACTATTLLPYLPIDTEDLEDYSLASVIIISKQWVGRLFKEHGNEMRDTLEDYPTMATGILSFITLDTPQEGGFPGE